MKCRLARSPPRQARDQAFVPVTRACKQTQRHRQHQHQHQHRDIGVSMDHGQTRRVRRVRVPGSTSVGGYKAPGLRPGPASGRAPATERGGGGFIFGRGCYNTHLCTRNKQLCTPGHSLFALHLQRRARRRQLAQYDFRRRRCAVAASLGLGCLPSVIPGLTGGALPLICSHMSADDQMLSQDSTNL